MYQKNMEALAAERLLESGVRVKIPAPLFLRILGKKQISLVVRQPYMGTLLHLSKLAMKAGFDFEGIDKGEMEAAHTLIINHTKTACRIIAVIVLNRRLPIKLFARPLAWWLAGKLKPRKLAEITLMAVMFSGVQDFTNSIRLIRSLRITAPKNLSPGDQGSHEGAHAGSIAPGEQSGA